MNTDDLCSLPDLDQDIILKCLHERFDGGIFYTYIGDLLIAINPCKPLPIYTDAYHQKYDRARQDVRAPHVFWTASQAYQNLRTLQESQCIIVSGESGAGKTESTKYIFQHLVRQGDCTIPSLTDRLQKVNPLLELFGNASTALNPNSSRFGKLVELYYDCSGTLHGADIEFYTLEKSRIVHHQAEERNFHVFYSLFAGMPKQKLLYYYLEGNLSDYRILVDEAEYHYSRCQSIRNTEELREYKIMFEKTEEILRDLQFTDELIDQLYKVLAAILLLSNISFTEDEANESFKIYEDHEERYLVPACELLGIEEEAQQELVTALLANTHHIRGEELRHYKSLEKAEDGRDALVKQLYLCVFEGIIMKINTSLQSQIGRHSKDSDLSICVLDISGFENLRQNSFEQLLINITNEKLHQFFLEKIFVCEKDDYIKEGISFVDVLFKDNIDVLNLLLQTPCGVIPILEDQISIPKSTDAGFIQHLDSHNNQNEYYNCRSEYNTCHFGIVHYAGEVVYNGTGFLKKNTDTLSNSLKRCLLYSSNEFILNKMYDRNMNNMTLSERAAKYISNGFASADKAKRGKLQDYETKHFKKSLLGLEQKLRIMKPWFVKCVKPNEKLRPERFDTDLVRRQLLSSGVLEVAKVRRDGFPLRYQFEDFIKRFKKLVEPADHTDAPKTIVENVLHRAGITEHRIGPRKVFLKYDHEEVLDRRIQEKIQKEKEEETKRRREEEKNRIQSSSISNSRVLELSTPVVSKADAKVACSTENPQRSNSVSSVGSDLSSITGENSNVSFEEKKQFQTEEEEEPKIFKPETTSDFKKKKAYDMFRQTERDYDGSNRIEEMCLRATRLFLCCMLFVGVLVTGVWSKISIISMITMSHKIPERRNELTTQVLLCILVPLGLTWLMALLKWLFGKKKWLDKRILVAVVILETLPAIGTGLLVFKALPYVDNFRGIIILLHITFIPALLTFLETIHYKRKKFFERCLKLVLATVVLCIQIGMFIMMYVVKFDRGSFLSDSEIEPWVIPVAILLVSVKWWENFIHHDIKKDEKPFVFVNYHRKQLLKSRDTTNVVLIPVKACVYIGLAFLLVTDFEARLHGNITSSVKALEASSDAKYNISQISTPPPVLVNVTDIMMSRTITFMGNTTNSASDKLLKDSTQSKTATTEQTLSSTFQFLIMHGQIILQVLATLVCSYLSGLACKWHMQQLSFCLPLVLTTPFCLSITFLSCRGDLPILGFIDILPECPKMDLESLMLPIIFGSLLWISILLMTYYIWFPRCERMAKLERIFVDKMKNSVFVDISLLLSRRNDHAEDNSSSKGDKERTRSETPMVYVCATMWHETQREMTQLLKSLFRLDAHIAASKQAEKMLKTEDPDKFESEIHIIFDDAFKNDEKVGQKVLNEYVIQLVHCVGAAATSVAKGDIEWDRYPKKYSTPYGGRLVWTMPGGVMMVVHLKDKSKIRHRKRWSQILYMYYLLGLTFFQDKTAGDLLDKAEKENKRRQTIWPHTSLLNILPHEEIEKASNTFILALDGDVDFQPESVLVLIDRMKKNKKVGAVCGRIHPIGSGPMVWYQQFEYAVGHWLQKAAEHVFGCVLCCPGCFSLFRASAIMDDNVMNTYTTKPTEARHYIQFEQGEDRWLCTLLLQQGYKIDYAAGADALTFAPETFNEFYVQRRRWAPSTMANIMDLLSSWRVTVQMNDNISTPYVFYQFVLMATSLLAPGTVTLMIAGSYQAVLGLSTTYSYLLSVIPVLAYMVICLKCKSEIQLQVAAFFTSLYTIVMMIVTVGTILSIVNEEFLSPNVLFLEGIGIVFTTAAIWHPKEFWCLVHGLLYFFTVPSTFIFLTVYYLCNLHNVSWGTREGPKVPSVEQAAAEEAAQKRKKKGLCTRISSSLGVATFLQELVEYVRQMLKIDQKKTVTKSSEMSSSGQSQRLHRNPCQQPSFRACLQVIENPTYWMEQAPLKESPKEEIEKTEVQFWNDLIRKYLYPLDEDKKQQEKIKHDLISLRNNVVFGFFLLNFMFSVALLQLQLNKYQLRAFYIVGKYEPVSVFFLSTFATLLFLQFIAMLIHRWGTFQHLISSTRVGFCKLNVSRDEMFREAIKESKKLQSAEPVPNYGINADDDDYSYYNSGSTIDRRENSSLNISTAIIEEQPDYSDHEDNEYVYANPQRMTAYDRNFRQNFKTQKRMFRKHERRRLQAAMGTRKLNQPPQQDYDSRRYELYNYTVGRRGGLDRVNQHIYA